MKITTHKTPRMQPCADVNPSLWKMFCELKGRPHEARSDVWTEFDVVQHLNAMCAKDIQHGKEKNGR